MTLERFSLCLAIAFAVLGPARAPAQTIGLYSDVDCPGSGLSVEPGATGTFYVAYSGPSGLVSVEFRIEGLPVEWSVLSVAAHPAATLVLGDPFAAGVVVGFPEPRSEVACLNLLTIQVLATSEAFDRILTPVQHMTPSNPTLQCPSASGSCDGPCSWQTCAWGRQLFLNENVSVDRSAWSQVKNLYR